MAARPPCHGWRYRAGGGAHGHGDEQGRQLAPALGQDLFLRHDRGLCYGDHPGHPASEEVLAGAGGGVQLLSGRVGLSFPLPEAVAQRPATGADRPDIARDRGRSERRIADLGFGASHLGKYQFASGAVHGVRPHRHAHGGERFHEILSEAA